MNQTSSPVALITGASSGIGEAAAKEFARHGYRVALAARRQTRLQALAEEIRTFGSEALVVPADVSDPESVERMVQTTLDAWGQIDVLVNNAGFGRLRRLENLHPVDDIEAQVRVNVLGVMWASRAVLPHMKTRGSGHIINVSSVAGWVAMPGYSIYAATKFAVRGFTEALRREALPYGVRVSGLYPGPVATEFSQHIGVKRKTSTPAWMTLTSEYTARVLYGLVAHPRLGRIIPWWFTPVLWLNSHLPSLADWLITRQFRRRSS
ncbi:MAG: SDR family oxidoreductase [Anaerolineae bacterium]|nr:MAG: SDR family oxidoreductase [Anaerolineae bacterium]